MLFDLPVFIFANETLRLNTDWEAGNDGQDPN